MDSLTCLQCLQPTITRTTLRQCRRIALAMVVMTGRVTMLGLSRWAGPGGSYRTVQRFFATVIPWATLFWVFFRHHVYRSEEVYLLVGDEVVVTKAGKTTHGLNRFFASLYGKPVPGLVVCQILIDGYTCLSLTRASATVKRQLMVAFTSLRSAAQFLTSSWTTAEASRRRSRHWRCKILSSVSAMFNQLPCLGVEWISNRRAKRRASAGRNAS